MNDTSRNVCTNDLLALLNLSMRWSHATAAAVVVAVVTARKCKIPFHQVKSRLVQWIRAKHETYKINPKRGSTIRFELGVDDGR